MYVIAIVSMVFTVLVIDSYRCGVKIVVLYSGIFGTSSSRM